MLLDEPLIFERGAAGRIGWPVAEPPDGGQAVPALPAALQRDDDLAGFPEVSELEVVRHFVRLSQWNYSAATTLYPLGSCTMKYNPVVNEALARLPGLAALHPLVPDQLAQGALELVAGLEAALAAVSGLDAVCLQPAAGAQGELLGMLLVRAFHTDRGDPRRRVLIPSSAHGTNPASAALCGYQVAEVPVDARGLLPAAAPGAVPAGAAARPARRRTRRERGGTEERRPHAVVLRQLRRPRQGVRLHRPPRRGRSGRRDAARRAERELRAGPPPDHLPPPVRHPVAARVRVLGPPSAGFRRQHARHRKASARLRVLRSHHLLPAGREGGADDRADGDGDEGDARRLRERAPGDRRGGPHRSGAAPERTPSHAPRAPR